MAKKLKTLFTHRQQHFEKNTDAIFTVMLNVTNGIIEFLNLKNEISQGQLTWTNIINQEADGLVTIIGLIKYPPGSQFETAEGQTITVSEDTVDYFTRIMKFTLPFELANNGTFDDVVAFLTSLEADGQEQTDIVELPGEALKLADFEYEELTEEQKAAMVIDYQDTSVH